MRKLHYYVMIYHCIKISKSVLSTMVAVIRFVSTHWDHFIVAVEVDIDSQVMEELALVRSQYE